MCLSKAYLLRDGQRQLLLEEVASLDADGDRLHLKTLFGEQRELRARVREIDLLSHSILLEESKAP
jgi:predicted RNA-binding protein